MDRVPGVEPQYIVRRLGGGATAKEMQIECNDVAAQGYKLVLVSDVYDPHWHTDMCPGSIVTTLYFEREAHSWHPLMRSAEAEIELDYIPAV